MWQSLQVFKTNSSHFNNIQIKVILITYKLYFIGLMLVLVILIMLIQTAPRSARDRARMGLLHVNIS